MIDGIPHELIDESADGYMGAVQYRFSLYYPSKEEMKCCASEGLWTYGGRLNKLELSGLLTEEEERNDEDEKINKVLEHTGCENIIFHESNRKSCLNDILKCHDLNYIQKLKKICQSKPNNSSFKKQDNHEKAEKGLNIPKLLSKLDTTNPLYKNFF